MVKNPPANAGDKRFGFDLWVGKIPWRRAWQPTLVSLPGEYPWTEEPVWATVHSVVKSQTQLKRLSLHAMSLIQRQENGVEKSKESRCIG